MFVTKYCRTASMKQSGSSLFLMFSIQVLVVACVKVNTGGNSWLILSYE